MVIYGAGTLTNNGGRRRNEENSLGEGCMALAGVKVIIGRSR